MRSPGASTPKRARGVLLRPIGNTVYLMPPYVLDDATIDWLASRTMAAFDATMRDLGGGNRVATVGKEQAA